MARPVNPLGLLRSIPRYATYGANDAIAKALLEQAPHLAKHTKARSLGTRIGQLDQGNSSWWHRHPAYAAGLAELLEVSLSDLGLHGGAAGDHLFSFDAFPELPPLDLTREPAWKLFLEHIHADQRDPGSASHPTLEHWLAPATWMRRWPTDMDWLCVTDDLERKLLVRTLSAAGHFDVLQVETLADAGARLLRPQPLIILLRADSGQEDVAVLACRPEHAGILVIAPHMPPMRQQTSSAEFMGWEYLESNRQVNNSFRLDMSGRHEPLKRWTWSPLPDWRMQLLAWVEERIDRPGVDTLFSAQRIRTWLNQFDPRGEWFCSTTDMLQLCRIDHHHRVKLPAVHDAHAGKILTGQLFATDPVLERHVTQLAVFRWQRRDLPWEGALPDQTWLALQSAPGEDKMAPPNRRHLSPDGMLNRQRNGYADFRHRTLASLVVRDTLIRHITDDPLETWAWACFDPQRRPLVDAALDAVALPGLAGAMDRLKQQAPHSAAAVGASEALFMTLARRIANGEKPPGTYMVVAQCVLERLDCSMLAWSCPTPWSRPAVEQHDLLEWITACWAWSTVWQPAPAMAENWLFPGWCKPLAPVPHWLTSLWPDQQSERLAPAWRAFFTVAQLWASDLTEPVFHPPRILRMAMLVEAAQGTWPADAAWWQELAGMNSGWWVADILLEQLKQTKPDAASKLWPSLLAFEQSSPDYFVRLSPVRRWLLEQLTAAEALALIDQAGREYLGKVPQSLPPAFRAPLLTAISSTVKLGWGEALPFFRRFGPSTAAVLPDFLADEIAGRAAAQCLWEWQPERAACLLGSDRSSAELALLLEFCPPHQLACAVALLSARPDLLEASTCRWWIHAHLSHAGPLAERLLLLLAALPPDDL